MAYYKWGRQMVEKFDRWKADIVRARLFRYRRDKAQGKSLLSISALLQHISLCPSVAGEMLDGQTGQVKIDDEWLLRFTNGQSGLPFARVDSLRRFLIFEGYLAEEELSESPVDRGEMLSLYGYLGNAGEPARTRSLNMPSRFTCRLDVESKGHFVRLNFEQEDDLCLFAVEEDQFNYPISGVDDRRKMKDASFPRRRKGYAFLSTRENALHIFVRGEIPSDRTHYFELISLDGSANGRSLLLAYVGQIDCALNSIGAVGLRALSFERD